MQNAEGVNFWDAFPMWLLFHSLRFWHSSSALTAHCHPDIFIR
jgi:hypothetical protein